MKNCVLKIKGCKKLEFGSIKAAHKYLRNLGYKVKSYHTVSKEIKTFGNFFFGDLYDHEKGILFKI